jgi:hypothetical protein
LRAARAFGVATGFLPRFPVAAFRGAARLVRPTDFSARFAAFNSARACFNSSLAWRRFSFAALSRRRASATAAASIPALAAGVPVEGFLFMTELRVGEIKVSHMSLSSRYLAPALAS